MKKISVILIAAIIACQSKPESSNPTVESEVNSTGFLDYLQEESTISFASEFNCLILPPAELYPDSIIHSTLPDIIKVTPATWISKTNGLYSYSATNDLCEGFPLFQFQFSTDSKGWVHGSQVFLAADRVAATVTLQNISYEHRLAISTGIGVANDVGTTGCMEYQLLYLLDRSNKLIHLVSVNPSLQKLNILGNANQQWFSYISDEGMFVTIKSATVVNDQLVIDHLIEYQEGSREAKMYLIKVGNNFLIARIDAGTVME